MDGAEQTVAEVIFLDAGGDANVSQGKFGNAYVTGASLRYTEGAEESGHEDIATVKYGPDGKELVDRESNRRVPNRDAGL